MCAEASLFVCATESKCVTASRSDLDTWTLPWLLFVLTDICLPGNNSTTNNSILPTNFTSPAATPTPTSHPSTSASTQSRITIQKTKCKGNVVLIFQPSVPLYLSVWSKKQTGIIRKMYERKGSKRQSWIEGSDHPGNSITEGGADKKSASEMLQVKCKDRPT